LLLATIATLAVELTFDIASYRVEESGIYPIIYMLTYIILPTELNDLIVNKLCILLSEGTAPDGNPGVTIIIITMLFEEGSFIRDWL